MSDLPRLEDATHDDLLLAIRAVGELAQYGGFIRAALAGIYAARGERGFDEPEGVPARAETLGGGLCCSLRVTLALCNPHLGQENHMAPRPKTDVFPEDGPRKQAGRQTRLVMDGIHLRTQLPVRDATEGRFIEVTSADAMNATQSDPRNCGFSQCARRVVKGLLDVEFYTSVAYFIFQDHVERYLISGSTQRALYAFDVTGMFRPGAYWLTAPNSANKLTAPKDGKPRLTREDTVAAVKRLQGKGRSARGVNIPALAAELGRDEGRVRHQLKEAVSHGEIKNTAAAGRPASYVAGRSTASKARTTPKRPRRQQVGAVIRAIPS